MKSILVIGATGNIGRQVIAHLVQTDARVRALTRKPDSAKLPATVEVVSGDLAIPDGLDACLEGMDTVFLVWMPTVAFAPVWRK